VFNVRCLTRATQDDVVHGSKAVGEPPLMLAISVREALRAAVTAFGDGRHARLACPATPEAVYWAIEQVRAP
jgi:xanthine dehydrogenase large subunit